MFLSSPLPWRHRLVARPQSTLCDSSFLLGSGIQTRVRWPLLMGVRAIPPSHAGTHLLQVDIVPKGDHYAGEATIIVALVPIHDHLLALNPLRQVLSRPAREGLPFLGSVDSGKSDAVGLPIRAAYHDAISVSHGDDATSKLGGMRGDETR